MKLKFNGILVLLIVLMTQFTFAQERTVSGVVSDNAGLPLPGVSVLVKGTKSGTQTDFDGKYSIKVSPSQVLVFSYIGMKTQETTANLTNINVKLKDDSVELEGVVVTALGVKREKKSLGYATQEVKGDILREGGNSGNMVSSLTGKAAGVQVVNSGNFGGSSSIVIRGMKSIQGNNQALIVIDGVPVNNSSLAGAYANYDAGNAASDINPNDIESVNVLKGAAASALYGERAASGVVVITTKKGKASKNDSWGITLNSQLQIGNIDKSTFVKYQKKYGAGYGSNNYSKDGFDLEDVNGDGTDDLVAPTYDDASLGAAFDPNLDVYQWNAFDPSSPNFGKATPWNGAKNDPSSFFETSITKSNSITLENGNDVSNIVINFNNYLTNGVLPNSDQRKNTISTKFSYKINDKLTANVYSSLTFQNTIGRNVIGYNDNIITNFRQWWATNVDIKEQKDAYLNAGGQNISWNIKGYNKPSQFNTPNFWNNPYYDRYKNYQSDNRTRFFGYGMLNYKLTNSINLTGRVSTDFWNQKEEQRLSLGSVPTNFGISGLGTPSGYFLGNLSNTETNYDFFANYNTKLENSLSIGGLLGTSYRRNGSSQSYTSTEGGLIVPGLYAIRNSAGSTLPTSETLTTSSLSSAYGQLTLGYKDTYFLEGTGRVDQSSNLPSSNNTYFYPSVSGSIVLSNLLKQDWLSYTKLRGNWAQVGKATGNYGINDTYSIVGLYGNTPIVNPRTFKNNPDLKPEISTEVELGIEAKFLNNRLGFDISAYKTNSKDQIMRVDVSSASGYAQKWINAGEIENKGIELQLNVIPVKTKNLTWDVTFNWATNENKVINLAPGINNLLLGTAVGSVTYNAQEGESYGTIKGTDYIYAPDGQRVIDASTGRYKITATKTNVIGNIMPDWVAGVRNSITYKNASLSFLIDGQKGGDVYSGDMYYGTDTGLYKSTLAVREAGYALPGVVESTPGVFVTNTTPIRDDLRPENTGSVNYSTNAANKEFVYDASFIKLREVTLNYNLPSKWFNNKMNASFSIFGRNLWIIQKNLPFADPESGTSIATAGVQGNNLSRGYSIGAMPTLRTVGASFTLKF